MGQLDKDKVARLVREGRTRKGITQQELSEACGISLRSVQRIENGEVLPRLYTIRVLAEQLEIADRLTETAAVADEPESSTLLPPESAVAAEEPANLKRHAAKSVLNTPRKIILTIGIALIILLGVVAFLAQSARFPETSPNRGPGGGRNKRRDR